MTEKKREWPESVLAAEFKKAVCLAFCRDGMKCGGCPAYKIDADTYKELKIRDIIGLPGRRRRR